MTARHKSIYSFLALVFTLVIGIPFAARAQEAQTSESPAEDAAAIAIKEVEKAFEYQIEGRPDPFLPFITESATSTPDNLDEVIEDNRVLTGMQLFEPGQLTLVGLISAGDTKFAMVQDFTGKGYIIEEGTKIGRRGVVTEIADNKIVISETARTRGGKTLTNNIAMVLKKEGEE